MIAYPSVRTKGGETQRAGWERWEKANDTNEVDKCVTAGFWATQSVQRFQRLQRDSITLQAYGANTKWWVNIELCFYHPQRIKWLPVGWRVAHSLHYTKNWLLTCLCIDLGISFFPPWPVQIKKASFGHSQNNSYMISVSDSVGKCQSSSEIDRTWFVMMIQTATEKDS